MPNDSVYIKKRVYLPADLYPKKSGMTGAISVSDSGAISAGGFVPSGPGSVASQGMSPDDIKSFAQGVLSDLDILASVQTIDRGMIGRVVTVTSTPTLLIKATQLRGYIITNPSATAGLTATGTVLASALHALGTSGNTQGTPLGVANYDTLRLFLNISASGGGVVTIDAQTQDPLSSNWATSQANIFGSVSAVGTYYAHINSIGVDTEFAIAWSVSAAGSSTFSVGYVLKDGLAGSASGIDNTVYLGGAGVSTVAGYSLKEGAERAFYLRANAELWAVCGAGNSVNLRVLELQ